MKTLLTLISLITVVLFASCTNNKDENKTAYIVGFASPDSEQAKYNSMEIIAVSYSKEYNVGDTVLMGVDNTLISAPNVYHNKPSVVYILHKFK